MLRVAVFGCGYWAAFQVAAWQAQGAEIVALWNRTYEKAEVFAQKWGIKKVFKTPEEVFEWGEFDIADIITDVDAHERLTIMAAQYGKAVICQKPMAYTLESCKRMVDACETTGVWYAVHENFRYQPPTERFIEAVNSGVIGKVLSAEINMRSPDLDIIEKQPALRVMPHMVLRDMGPHIFDVARAAFGEMKTMYAVPVYSYKSQGIDVPDAAVCVMNAQSGAVVTCNLVHDWNDRFTVTGEKGKIVLDKDNVLHIITDDGEQVLDTKTWETLAYIPEDDWSLHGGHIMSAIPRCLDSLMEKFAAGEEAETSGKDNYKTIELVFAAIESFESGEVIKL